MLHLVWYGLLAILLAAGIFALAARFLPAGEQIAPPLRDEPPWELPPDRSLQPDEIDGVRLPVALRGYRFAETDLLLDRLAAELRVRDAEITQLRGEAPAVALAPAGAAPPTVDGLSVDDTPGYEPLPFDVPFGPPPVLPLGDEDAVANGDDDAVVDGGEVVEPPPAEHPEPLLDLTDHSGPALPAPETFDFWSTTAGDDLDDELAVSRQMSDELAFPEPGVDGSAETVPVSEPVPFDALFGPLPVLPPQVGGAAPDFEVAADGDHVGDAPPAEQSEPLLDLTDHSGPPLPAPQTFDFWSTTAGDDLHDELAVSRQMSDELAFPEPGVDGSAETVPVSEPVPFDALFGPLPVLPPQVGDAAPDFEVAADGDHVGDAPPAEQSELLVDLTVTSGVTAVQSPSEDGAAPDLPEELAVAQQVSDELAFPGRAVEEAPLVEAPVEQAPVDEQPVDEQPVDEQPVDEQPVDEQPVDELAFPGHAVEEAPLVEAPVEQAPVDEQPVDEQPAQDQPAPEESQPFNPPVYAPPIPAAHLPFAPPRRIQPDVYAPPPIVHPVYMPPGLNRPAEAPAAAYDGAAPAGVPVAPPTWALTAPPWAVAPVPPVALHPAAPPASQVQPETVPPPPPDVPAAAGDRSPDVNSSDERPTRSARHRKRRRRNA